MKKSLLIAATASLILSACNKDDGTDAAATSHFPEDGIIRVTTSVNEAVLTRASLTTETVSHFWLNVTTGDGSDPTYNYVREIERQSADDEWETKGDPMLWKDDKTSIRVTALQYGSAGFSADDFTSRGTTLALIDDQSTQDKLNDADLLIMKPTTVDPQTNLDENGAIKVTLTHGLAKIDVTLTLNTQFFKDHLFPADISDFTVTSYNKFRVSPTNQTAFVYNDGNLSTIPVKAFQSAHTDATAESSRSTATYECIVVPTIGSNKTTLTVRFAIGDKYYSWTSAETALESGHRYAIALEVGDDAVTLAPDGITATPWNAEQESNPANLNTY
jgi:hypothetical protein